MQHFSRTMAAVFVTVAVAIVGVLIPSPSIAGSTPNPLACLIGTDRAVAVDFTQIQAVRQVIDTTACPASYFDGTTPYQSHAAYIRCATHVIQNTIITGGLRQWCFQTVRAIYVKSSVGHNPRGGPQTAPCIQKEKSSGAVSCKGILRASECVTNNSQATDTWCPNNTECLQAADTNCNLEYDRGDTGQCAPVPVPGDGIIECGEKCDDGNTVSGDGCSATMQVEPCYTCTGQPSVCTPIVCAASDQCHVAGTCDPASGQCSNPPASNTTSCDDGNKCTQNDTCDGNGKCAGSPMVCTASDQCHVAGTCNPASGQCSNPPASNTTSCDDGNKCTQNDTCDGNGNCVGTPVTCANECNACDPATGACTGAYRPGASCNGTTLPCIGGICTTCPCAIPDFGSDTLSTVVGKLGSWSAFDTKSPSNTVGVQYCEQELSNPSSSILRGVAGENAGLSCGSPASGAYGIVLETGTEADDGSYNNAACSSISCPDINDSVGSPPQWCATYVFDSNQGDSLCNDCSSPCISWGGGITEGTVGPNAELFGVFGANPSITASDEFASCQAVIHYLTNQSSCVDLNSRNP